MSALVDSLGSNNSKGRFIRPLLFSKEELKKLGHFIQVCNGRLTRNKYNRGNFFVNLREQLQMAWSGSPNVSSTHTVNLETGL
jgi:hypothetical protein